MAEMAGFGIDGIYVFIAGLKFAIFLGVLSLALLIDRVADKKYVHGLNIMGGALMLAALAELLHIISHAHNGEVFSWFMAHYHLYLVTHSLLIIAGIGIIWYFIGIRKNIKDYQ